MYAISNAFMHQAEIVQKNRWADGSLEITFINEDQAHWSTEDRLKFELAVWEWNQSYAAGHVRDPKALAAIVTMLPGIQERSNPNLIVAPRLQNGLSELHVMLAALLPDNVLADLSISRERTNMSLSLVGRRDNRDTYSEIVEKAFAKFIWASLVPGKRSDHTHFSERSPLRLLAGDTRFWMNRIYRVALERREKWFEPTEHEEGWWKPIEELSTIVAEGLSESERNSYFVRRPLMGGTIWDENDEDDRASVIEAAITGDSVMESIEPVLDLLRTHRAHEDFSEYASWVKEDFERSFYSKRSKLKVELVETIDDMPVWDAEDCEGYGDLLYRDLLAAIDMKDQRLLVALRMGKTVGEIAADRCLTGHASVSRSVARLKQKVAQLLTE